MKIMTWNCSGNFRGKADKAFACDADIYVIQECENPQKYTELQAAFHNHYVWYGLNDNRGLCLIWKDYVTVKNNDWSNYGLRHFISVNVNGSFDLIGVWAGFPYIEEYYIYQQIHKAKYSPQTVIVGDFNSNAIWDKDHKERNHSAVVQQLNQMNLVSAYHNVSKEAYGEESVPTFYLHKDPNKAYHIDYCFLRPDRIRTMNLLDAQEWLLYSDHVPLLVDIDG